GDLVAKPIHARERNEVAGFPLIEIVCDPPGLRSASAFVVEAVQRAGKEKQMGPERLTLRKAFGRASKGDMSDVRDWIGVESFSNEARFDGRAVLVCCSGRVAVGRSGRR